ncbi:hypothetical protein ACFSUS_25335 [Spirosoma soli]|uniref:Uncharacterized protein n=1 Tax=Spirosoma soli TaxID=1770529 RepID=A0ABW5MAA1_9BACT
MKRIVTTVIGVALFVAGYYHTRRQSEYISAHSADSNSVNVQANSVNDVQPQSYTVSNKQLYATQLVKPL